MYFNILNGTASIILSGEPYHFGSVSIISIIQYTKLTRPRSSMVGLSYLGPIIGVILA